MLGNVISYAWTTDNPQEKFQINICVNPDMDIVNDVTPQGITLT